VEMSEGQARFVDAACKIAGVVALIAGGLWTLGAYIGHLKEVTTAAEIEAWKPYLSKRLELYIDVTNLVGQAIVADDPEKSKKATQDLAILYYGRSRLFAEDTVQKAWTDFEVCRIAKGDANCPKKVNIYAAILGRRCREAVAKEWGIDLPEDAATLQMLEGSRN
jgi:hypothetical protein